MNALGIIAKQKCALRPAALLALLMALPALAQAQTFSLDWSTLDGGGGGSTGGVYALRGTIGQVDAGRHSGGSFVLEGGFWSIVTAVQTPGAPLLTVTHTNNSVTLSWPLPAEGFVLDETPTLTGAPPPWTLAAGSLQTNATHIYLTIPPAGGPRYYRLRKP